MIAACMATTGGGLTIGAHEGKVVTSLLLHQVKRAQIALLEFVMKTCKREGIAIMARRCGCRAHLCFEARCKQSYVV